MGKTHSKPSAARHGRGTAWARQGHGMLCVNRPLLSYAITIHFLSSHDKSSNTKLKLPNMSPFGRPSGCYQEVGNACGLLWKTKRTFGFYKMRGIALRPANLPPTKEKFGSTVLGQIFG